MRKKIEQFTQVELKVMRKESNQLLAQLHAGMEANVPPDDLEMISCARRLKELQAPFSGDDPEMEKAIERFHIEHPDVWDYRLIGLKFYRYIEKAKSFS